MDPFEKQAKTAERLARCPPRVGEVIQLVVRLVQDHSFNHDWIKPFIKGFPSRHEVGVASAKAKSLSQTQNDSGKPQILEKQEAFRKLFELLTELQQIMEAQVGASLRCCCCTLPYPVVRLAMY
jgi:hypothetical protein